LGGPVGAFVDMQGVVGVAKAVGAAAQSSADVG